MPQEPYFDGRSFLVNPLRYSLRERLVARFAMQVMPLLTLFICSHRLNTWVWRLLGCKVGPRSVIRVGTAINAPFMVSIGADCRIHGHLKSRGGILIGNGVEFVEDVMVSTQSHNMDSPLFESVYSPVEIEDYVWIGPRAVILPKALLARGSVVAAGAVVTKDTEAWGIYGGVPARRIKSRAQVRIDEVKEALR